MSVKLTNSNVSRVKSRGSPRQTQGRSGFAGLMLAAAGVDPVEVPGAMLVFGGAATWTLGLGGFAFWGLWPQVAQEYSFAD